MRSRSSLADLPGGSVPLTLALVLLLITPGHPAGVLRGLPLEPVVTEIALPLAFLLWAGWSRAPLRGQRSLVAGIVTITVLKTALGMAAPEPGAIGSYFGRARLTDPPERSLDFPRLNGATRVDRVLDFDQSTLPVAFFNDNDRFNFYQPGEPDRQRLPLIVQWTGWMTAPETRTYRLWLTAIGDASVSIDGGPALNVAGGRSAQPQMDARPMELTEGPHDVRLQYQRSQGTSARIALEWDVRGDREAVRPPYLFTKAVSAPAMALEEAKGRIAAILDWVALSLALLSVLVSLSRWERVGVRAGRLLLSRGAHPDPLPAGEGVDRPLLGLWGALIATYGIITSLHLIGQTIVLEGGQDWLTYEYYARDILLNGPLMTLGKALGQGRAFVFQPLYPYYLAALHWLFGEGLFGPRVAHFAGFGVAGIVLFYLARALFGARAASLTLGLMTVLIFTQLDVVARRLLSENLYFFVLPAALVATLHAGRAGGWRRPLVAGALMGIACLTRAPTLLIVPVAMVVLALVRHPRGALVFFVATVLVVSLAPIRNYIVSGRPALVATNAGATLLLAHPLTEKVRLRGVDQHPIYNRLGLDRPTREMIEFVIQDPLGYAATLVPLTAYTLGFPGMVEPDSPPAWELVAILVLYLMAVLTLPRVRQRETWIMHAFIASHFLVMITFLPYVYGYRQVLPMYLVMLPFCGALISKGWPGLSANLWKDPTRS